QLARNKEIIDNVRTGLFNELVFQTMGRQHYLNLYGRERLRKLKEGIESLLAGDQSAASIIDIITQINAQLRLRRVVDMQLRDRVRDLYNEPLGKQEQEFLRMEISHKLKQQGVLNDLIAPELFAAAL